jgi:Ca2+-binding EF-hand superfamily protein
MNIKITEASELSIRECIYGCMLRYDRYKKGVIHSSDFSKVIGDLGMPLGHKVVEDMLNHCQIDSETRYIDFTGLDKELKHQRGLFNNRSKITNKKPVSSSSVADISTSKSTHWQAQMDHKKRIQTAKYEKTVRAHRDEIREIFEKYAHDQITSQQVLDNLLVYDIVPNHLFKVTIDNSRRSDDLSFREFYSALFKHDTDEDTNHYTVRAAGSNQSKTIHHLSQSNSDVQFKPLRRTHTEARAAQERISSRETKDTFKFAKAQLQEDSNPTGDAALFKRSNAIQDSLRLMDPGEMVQDQMMSHNQRMMMQGKGGNEPSFKYNVEIKLLREQFLVSLRRLDSGEISYSDFVAKVYELGIEIDPSTLGKIEHGLKQGTLNTRELVKNVDSSFFHKKAMSEVVSESTFADLKRRAFDAVVGRFGTAGLTQLLGIFKKVDDDNSGDLSFTEFVYACELYGLIDVLSEAELKSLFHTLDIDNSGGLDIAEFASMLREDIEGARKQLVRNAYNCLDVTGENSVSLEEIYDRFNASAHPDVLSNIRSERQVKSDMTTFFDISCMDDKMRGKVNFEQFLEYWATVSSMISDTEKFTTIITNVMNLKDLQAPPALVVAKKTAEGKGQEIASKAVQVHGDLISWKQEASSIEKEGSQMKLLRKQGDNDQRYRSSINLFAKDKKVEDDLDEMRSTGLSKINRVDTSNPTMMNWDTTKSGQREAHAFAKKKLENTLSAYNKNAASITDRVMNNESSNKMMDQFGEGTRTAGAPSGIFKAHDQSQLVSNRKISQDQRNKNFGTKAPYLDDDETGGDTNGRKISIENMQYRDSTSRSTVRVQKPHVQTLSAAISDPEQYNGNNTPVQKGSITSLSNMLKHKANLDSPAKTKKNIGKTLIDVLSSPQ